MMLCYKSGLVNNVTDAQKTGETTRNVTLMSVNVRNGSDFSISEDGMFLLKIRGGGCTPNPLNPHNKEAFSQQ